jgi:transcription elongation factor GreA
MTAKTIYLSKKGVKEFKKQISHLKHDLHEATRQLRELDKTDGHDERLARIEKLAQIEMIEGDLIEKQHTLAHSKLLPRKRDVLKVAIGSVVDLIDTQGRLVRYTIVESIEANPSDGRISAESPLGQRLIGKQIQDIIEWSAGVRINRWQLISIG